MTKMYISTPSSLNIQAYGTAQTKSTTTLFANQWVFAAVKRSSYTSFTFYFFNNNFWTLTPAAVASPHSWDNKIRIG
jgi:hypothetical protein